MMVNRPYELPYLEVNMAHKLKVTITISESVVRELDRLSKEKKESRSRVIEEAIELWRQKQLERALIKGYLAMGKEDVELAESNFEAGVEVLK
jgi:metal-responsive CopG/Arc/MetJ family transcriptional regulator